MYTNQLKNFGLMTILGSLLSFSVHAQTCQIAPTCEELGFDKTASDCEGISSIKCPFDENYRFCVGQGWISEFIGTGTPAIGSILYSDGTLNTALISGKKPIAVVFDAENLLAVAIEQNVSLAWLDKGDYTSVDIPGLPNLSEDVAKLDMNGRENTLIISEYCKATSTSCPAVEYVLGYYTEGTVAGQWFLPSGGQLISLLSSIEVINPVLRSLSSSYQHIIRLPTSDSLYGENEGYWSSSEPANRADNFAYFGGLTGFGNSSTPVLIGVHFSDYKNTPRLVRPIIHFEVKQ